MRIAYILTHPIQYQSPLIRHLVSQGINIRVVYATDITAAMYHDIGFGKAIEWDLPLLQGYDYSVLKPNSQIPSGFRGIRQFVNLIKAEIQRIDADVIWVHGWGNAYSIAGVVAGWSLGKRILLRGETHMQSLSPNKSRLRRMLHKLTIRNILSMADAFLAVGTANSNFYREHGISKDRIFMTPYVVDNERFQSLARQSTINSESIRQSLSIRDDQPIVLYCAKLIDVKDPCTLIKAIGMLNGVEPVLLMVGDGARREMLEDLAKTVAPGRVRFVGFKNQSELPAYYAACDLFVLPSVFEPWGLVINEVMNAGKPVIASSCVGAVLDLIVPGLNGDVFEAGCVEDLREKLVFWLSDRKNLQRAGEESLRLINQWDFESACLGLMGSLAYLNTLNKNK